MNRTLLAIYVLTVCTPLLAETSQVDRVSQMGAIAQALGVQCSYCHSAARGSGELQPKKEIARAMMDMTDEINSRLRAATGKAAGQVTVVQCEFCHRGVPIPKPIGDIMWQTIREKNVTAAIEQYRDLRTHFYGRAAYDFGEDALILFGQRLANIRPEDAIALLNLNLEYYPLSARTYMAKSFAQTRKLDDESAIASLEKALEIDPDNSLARGSLEQLKRYRRIR